MNEAVGVGDPHAPGGIPTQLVPTVIEWKSKANEVCILVSGYGDQWIKLHNHGNTHSIMLNLQPGRYWFQYRVDGSVCFDPKLSRQVHEDGETYNILSVNEDAAAWALIEWNYSADEVDVYGSWDGYCQATRLQKHGNGHSVMLRLKPGDYWYQYHVDGQLCHNPSLSWRFCEDGRNYNYMPFHVPEFKPRPDGKVMVPLSITRSCQSVCVSGSWDGWKQRVPLIKSGNDHYLRMRLHPGAYDMKFYVDGIESIRADIGIGYDPKGHPASNTVYAPPNPTSRYLHGTTGAALMEDFIMMSGHDLSIGLKFSAGSQVGSIDNTEKGYPCTELGYTLLGFFGSAKRTYMKGFSWGGCFGPLDMIVIDGKHCQITKPATQPLTRAHIMLDNLQFMQSLVMRFEKDGKYPPYFSHLIQSLINVPKDFDTNPASKAAYLSLYDNQAALATPPRRMLALVNMAQILKQLNEEEKVDIGLSFNSLLKDCEWQTIVNSDALLEALYRHHRKVEVDRPGNVIEPVPNTSLEAANCIRVFFIHGPEHTIVNGVQTLKAFAESDLIIAHYYHNFVAEMISLINVWRDKHVLIRATWDFYCGGTPPNHASVVQIDSSGHYQFKA